MSHRHDPVDALHAAVLASKLGIAGVAKRIGRSPQVLYNKFSESMPQSEPSVREALAMADAIETTVFAEAVAEHFGGVFVRLPNASGSDDGLLQDYMDIMQRLGDLAREVTEARQDGVISPEEFQAIRLRVHRSQSALAHYLAELETMVREVPPASPNALKKVIG